MPLTLIIQNYFAKTSFSNPRSKVLDNLIVTKSKQCTAFMEPEHSQQAATGPYPLTSCTSSPCSFPPLSQPIIYLHADLISHMRVSCPAYQVTLRLMILTILRLGYNNVATHFRFEFIKFTTKLYKKRTDQTYCGRCFSLATKIEVPVQCSGNKDVSNLWNQSLDSAPESNLYNFTQPAAVTSLQCQQSCKHKVTATINTDQSCSHIRTDTYS